MLLPIENILSEEEVRQCRAALEGAQWQDGKTTAGGQAARVKANLQLDEKTAVAARLRSIVMEKLGSHPIFIAAALPSKILPPLFNCYRQGGHYGLHVDNAVMHLSNHKVMRTDISATLFLSDPQEYDGGELGIETRYGAQMVKLDAGDVILYPSTSLHEVKPVTRGSRMCAVFWVQSLIQNSLQREQLFELDQSIQVLTTERGHDDAEIKRLTGVYHNLLRLWANV